MLGGRLNCVRCDRLEFPEGLAPYKATPRFDETGIPQGLLKNHSTKEGTWGVIHVLQGELIYKVFEPVEKELKLNVSNKGVVVPALLHCVKPNGSVLFFIEFFTKPENQQVLPKRSNRGSE